MEIRRLGRSGLRVPALSFGTATFGGGNDFFKAWGTTDAGGASRLIDTCLDNGVSLFDSADVYSDGLATVSVFIEDPATEAEVGEGFSTMGSTNVYSLTLSSGQKATAIGEVPRQTVRTIASSLVAQ